MKNASGSENHHCNKRIQRCDITNGLGTYMDCRDLIHQPPKKNSLVISAAKGSQTGHFAMHSFNASVSCLCGALCSLTTKTIKNLCFSTYPFLKLTASSPLKMNGWKTIWLSFGAKGLFQGLH